MDGILTEIMFRLIFSGASNQGLGKAGCLERKAGLVSFSAKGLFGTFSARVGRINLDVSSVYQFSV